MFAYFTYSSIPPSPLFPSQMSLMVSLDFKHHVTCSVSHWRGPHLLCWRWLTVSSISESRRANSTSYSSLPLPTHPFLSPSLISRMVSVDVKHHVSILCFNRWAELASALYWLTRYYLDINTRRCDLLEDAPVSDDQGASWGCDIYSRNRCSRIDDTVFIPGRGWSRRWLRYEPGCNEPRHSASTVYMQTACCVGVPPQPRRELSRCVGPCTPVPHPHPRPRPHRTVTTSLSRRRTQRRHTRVHSLRQVSLFQSTRRRLQRMNSY